MEERKIYKLGLYNQKNDYLGGYLKFNNIDDLYVYMGILFNNCYEEIKITYLYYYDRDLNNFDKSYFKEWLESVGNNGVLCRYKENKREYTIKLIIKVEQVEKC